MLSRTRLILLAALSLIIICCVLPLASSAQEAESIPKVELNRDAISDKINEIKEKDDLDESARGQLEDTYEEALSKLDEAKKYSEEAAEYKNATEQAPSSIADIREQLDQTAEDPDITPPPDASLSDLQQRLSEAENELSEVKQNLSKLKKESTRRPERQAEIAHERTQASEDLEEVTKKLSSDPPEGVSVPHETARRTLLRAREKALENKLEALEQERASYQARKELLPLRIDLLARKVQHATRKVDEWRNIVAEKRREDAQQAVKEASEAKREAAKAHPALQEVAARNEQLASQLTGAEGLTNRIGESEEELGKSQALSDSLRTSYENIRDKIETVGLTEAVGVLLMKKRGELPQVLPYDRRIRQRQSEISRVQFELMELEERRTDLAVLEPHIEEVLEQLPPSIQEDQKEKIADRTRSLLNTRRDLLDSLIRAYNTYFSTLIELNTTQQQLVKTRREFSNYIGQHVLWVQNHPPLSLESTEKAWSGLSWFVSPSHWKSLLQVLWQDLQQRLFIYPLVFAILALLLSIRKRLYGKMAEISEQLHHAKTDTIWHTPLALLSTIGIAMPGPVLLLFMAWRLNASVEVTAFSSSVAGGVEAAGYSWLFLSLLSTLCIPDGVATTHFRIRAKATSYLRRQIRWFAVMFVPTVFLTYVFQNQPNAAWSESIGRIAYLASIISLLAFLAVTFKPSGQLIANVTRRRGGTEVQRHRSLYLIYGFLLAAPAALLIAAGLGYYYSAVRLAERFYLTLTLLALVILLHYLTRRWIVLTRRQITVERIEKEREEDKKEEEEAGEESSETETSVEEPPVDLYSLGMQTRQFIQVALWCIVLAGLWLIWAEVLPALGILQKVHLWSVSVGSGAGAGMINITLANLLLAIIILALTIISARNVPGLVEISLLQHLPIDRGIRFAIRTLSRYVLIIIGIILIAAQIGVGWSRVQWLVAAMSVGLGFGLRDIFSDFVSGLIILFERPMRVGDTVTVGDVFGTVTKIRIRATTIEQWDRKELIVPNKQFITGPHTNWTLSDTILRMEFPVGIAYGSDIDLAEKVLYEVAADTDTVTDDPSPRVIFRSFGGSALQFELRLFIPNMDHYADTWHEVNRKINQRFKEHDITIAFPQQDVHLDLVDKDRPDVVKAEIPDDDSD